MQTGRNGSSSRAGTCASRFTPRRLYSPGGAGLDESAPGMDPGAGPGGCNPLLSKLAEDYRNSMRLCRSALRKGSAFPAPIAQFLFFRATGPDLSGPAAQKGVGGRSPDTKRPSLSA
jgi:hypothetical protein